MDLLLKRKLTRSKIFILTKFFVSLKPVSDFFLKKGLFDTVHSGTAYTYESKSLSWTSEISKASHLCRELPVPYNDKRRSGSGRTMQIELCNTSLSATTSFMAPWWTAGPLDAGSPMYKEGRFWPGRAGTCWAWPAPPPPSWRWRAGCGSQRSPHSSANS